MSRRYTQTQHFSGFMLSTSARLRQTETCPGLKSTQVPHTYSVTQPLPSHVCLWRYGQPKTAKFHVYTHRLNISVDLCSQLPPNSGNHRDIPDSTPHRYSTHILSPNYCRRMCICQAIVIQKSLKLTFIHPDSRIDCLHALNLCQTAWMTWVFWIMLYTGTPHIFGLPTTVIACVFVKQ